MSELEIKQLQKRIDIGILLTQKRLLESAKKTNEDLVIMRAGKVVRVKATEL